MKNEKTDYYTCVAATGSTSIRRLGYNLNKIKLFAEQELAEADILVKSLCIQYLSSYQQILFTINEPMWREQ